MILFSSQRRTFLLILLSVIWDCNFVWSKRWEESKIWPAAAVELYDKGTEILRTITALDFCIHHEVSAAKDLELILAAAKARFMDCFNAEIPEDPWKYPVNPSDEPLYKLKGIRIILGSNDTTLGFGIDESYSVHMTFPIDSNDENRLWIELKAVTVYGAMHGLETIKQLLRFGWMQGTEATFIVQDSPLFIQDEPVYSYRGLMIDTARHFLPVDLIVRNLRVMAANKLNVLHWHMTDSQAWPYQSDRFPELSDRGAYCEKCVYTMQELRSIVNVAAMLGIRVIVEFDLPGHSQAIGNSHPELLSLCGDNTISEPMDVSKTIVYNFVQAIYSEITSVFQDSWIHLGGDEVSLECWKNSSEIQRWIKSHNMTGELELLEYFEKKLIKLVSNVFDKRPIVWQDLLDSGVDLPFTVVLDVWKEWIAKPSVYNATKAGYHVLYSACWYLDHLNENWWAFHQCNPRHFANASESQQRLVIGGHSSMWGERVDGLNFFERVWPRASATAEVLWTGSPRNHTELSFDRVQLRLERFRCWMIRQFSIPISPIAPGYCNEKSFLSILALPR